MVDIWVAHMLVCTHNISKSFFSFLRLGLGSNLQIMTRVRSEGVEDQVFSAFKPVNSGVKWVHSVSCDYFQKEGSENISNAISRMPYLMFPRQKEKLSKNIYSKSYLGHHPQNLVSSNNLNLVFSHFSHLQLQIDSTIPRFHFQFQLYLVNVIGWTQEVLVTLWNPTNTLLPETLSCIFYQMQGINSFRTIHKAS